MHGRSRGFTLGCFRPGSASNKRDEACTFRGKNEGVDHRGFVIHSEVVPLPMPAF
jgi:hypothetical protein